MNTLTRFNIIADPDGHGTDTSQQEIDNEYSRYLIENGLGFVLTSTLDAEARGTVQSVIDALAHPE